jgi:hypothetical protein
MAQQRGTAVQRTQRVEHQQRRAAGGCHGVVDGALLLGLALQAIAA